VTEEQSRVPIEVDGVWELRGDLVDHLGRDPAR
jgi:hypothetical protein